MEKAVLALPDVGEIRYHYGYILLARGRKDEAREQLEMGLEMDPENKEAARAKDMLLQM